MARSPAGAVLRRLQWVRRGVNCPNPATEFSCYQNKNDYLLITFILIKSCRDACHCHPRRALGPPASGSGRILGLPPRPPAARPAAPVHPRAAAPERGGGTRPWPPRRRIRLARARPVALHVRPQGSRHL